MTDKMIDGMNPYVVLFYEADDEGGEPDLLPLPLAYSCHAETSDHAEDQCRDENPGREVLWVVQTDDRYAAYQDYWSADWTPAPENNP